MPAPTSDGNQLIISSPFRDAAPGVASRTAAPTLTEREEEGQQLAAWRGAKPGARHEACRTHATAGGAATEMTAAAAAAVAVAVPAEPDPTLEEQSPPSAAATVAPPLPPLPPRPSPPPNPTLTTDAIPALLVDHAGAAAVLVDLRCPHHSPCPPFLAPSLSLSLWPPRGAPLARHLRPVRASRVLSRK